MSAMSKMCLSQKHKKWLRLKGYEGQFTSDGLGGLWCEIYDKQVSAEKKSRMKQHIET